MTPLRTGIIGMGQQGRQLLTALAQSQAYDVRAIGDRSRERADELAARYDATAYDDYRSLIVQEELEVCIGRIRELQERFQNIGMADKGRIFNTELIDTIQTRNILEFSEVMAVGALAREESRGAHYRSDFPKRDDEGWLKHTMAWREDDKVKLDYKPVVITKWEPQERKY